VNHVVLFLYIFLIAAGTGGVVALAILHTRLRTPITAALLVANIGLFGALGVALVSFYVDTVLPTPPNGIPFEHSRLRTVLGYLCGVLVYGGLTTALRRIPAAPRRIVGTVGVIVLGSMTVQTGLIVFGKLEAAIHLGPVYLVVISVCIFAYGVIMIRTGPSVASPTLSWFFRSLGYLTAGFAVVSTGLYGVFSLVPVLQMVDLRLDFVFYVLWSGISIAAFLRYITRPSTVQEGQTISPAFLTAFGITPREHEIIRLIGQGLTNQEIADRLFISFGTVRTHVYNVFQKTGAGSRVDLLRLVSGFRE
jgi:DNA-binding CsgD family transcriptional regulator